MDAKAGLNCVLYDCITAVSVFRPTNTEPFKVGTDHIEAAKTTLTYEHRGDKRAETSSLFVPRANVAPAVLIWASQVSHLLTSPLTF